MIWICSYRIIEFKLTAYTAVKGRVAPPPPPISARRKSSNYRERRLHLARHPKHGFGFELEGSRPAFVKSVASGTPADHPDHGLFVNDQILAVRCLGHWVDFLLSTS